MEITINIERLKSIGLTLSQYIYLWSIYSQVKIKYLEISQEGLDNLVDRFYITKNGDEYVLLENGKEVFEPSKGLFEEFIKLFPTRVSNANGESRVLSPASMNSVSGKKMKTKFYRVTKNKEEFQRHVIRCLECELGLRKKEGNLYYMRNLETWLNKATWEDYEYLLEQTKKQESIGFKPSEIRL